MKTSLDRFSHYSRPSWAGILVPALCTADPEKIQPLLHEAQLPTRLDEYGAQTRYHLAPRLFYTARRLASPETDLVLPFETPTIVRQTERGEYTVSAELEDSEKLVAWVEFTRTNSPLSVAAAGLARILEGTERPSVHARTIPEPSFGFLRPYHC